MNAFLGNAYRAAHVYSNVLDIALKSVTFIDSRESNPKRENDHPAIDESTLDVFSGPMAGMALLMEGSTLQSGRYCLNIERAVNWLTKRAQPNGLIGDPNNPTESERYRALKLFSVARLR